MCDPYIFVCEYMYVAIMRVCSGNASHSQMSPVGRDESSNQPSRTSAINESTSQTSALFFRIDELVTNLWEQFGSFEDAETTATDVEIKWPRSRRVNYEYFCISGPRYKRKVSLPARCLRS